MLRIALTLSIVVPLFAFAQPVGGFKHIVMLIQENRTPDNLFGSNPTFERGVDIATQGLDSHHHIIPLRAYPFIQCWDVTHTNDDFKDMYRDGAMDGANLESTTTHNKHGCTVPADPAFVFVDNSAGAVQPYFDIAKAYGFANRMFQTNQGPSYPAHLILFSGTSAPAPKTPLFVAENTTGGGIGGAGAGCTAGGKTRAAVIDQYGNEKSNPAVYPCFRRETLATVLDAAGLDWRYYMNAPAVGERSLWNAPAGLAGICGAAGYGSNRHCASPYYARHVPAAKAQVLTDVAACRLAPVSWVIPDPNDSDHAGSPQDTGPSWVTSIVNAIGRKTCGDESYWNDTAILITWDDWGGWYDHVPPPLPNGQPNGWGRGYTYGFRVPLLVVSAYTPPGYVDNDNHDFGSFLAFIESNFGLPKIGPGNYADAYADNLAKFFTLSSARGFTPINAAKDAAYFLDGRRPIGGRDED